MKYEEKKKYYGIEGEMLDLGAEGVLEVLRKAHLEELGVWFFEGIRHMFGDSDPAFIISDSEDPVMGTWYFGKGKISMAKIQKLEKEEKENG